ncbi:MAG: LOG family protein [Leptospirales bacterium]
MSEALETTIRPVTRSLGRAIREGRRALDFFRDGKSQPTVAVFGSSRLSSEDPASRMAFAFGLAMARAGIRVLAGGDEGVMGSALKGAGEKGVALDWEPELVNPASDPLGRRLVFAHLSVRKQFFLWPARAVVLFPGGYGTLDELFEMMALRQTEEWARVPAFCADIPGRPFWKPLWGALEPLLREAPYLSPEAECPLRIVDDGCVLAEKVIESVMSVDH